MFNLDWVSGGGVAHFLYDSTYFLQRILVILCFFGGKLFFEKVLTFDGWGCIIKVIL